MVGQKKTCPSKNAAGDVPFMLYGIPSSGTKGLVVIQEWWGLNDQIQNCGETINKDSGLITAVPDLYRGKVTNEAQEATHYMDNLDWQGAVEDIAACVRYLKEQGCTKVGVTGFCMGGALSLASAVLIPEVDAAAPFYGIPSSSLCDVSAVRKPLQCHFGETDDIKGFSSPDDWKPLKQKLESIKDLQLEFYSYPTGHAFTNPTNPNFEQEIRDLAFSRLFTFMSKHLA